jgi:hypothetical protein
MLKLKKTKIMTTGPLKEFIVEGTEMKMINSYTFLDYNYQRWLRAQRKLTEDVRLEEWE